MESKKPSSLKDRYDQGQRTVGETETPSASGISKSAHKDKEQILASSTTSNSPQYSVEIARTKKEALENVKRIFPEVTKSCVDNITKEFLTDSVWSALEGYKQKAIDVFGNDVKLRLNLMNSPLPIFVVEISHTLPVSNESQKLQELFKWAAAQPRTSPADITFDIFTQ
jgi:hypothetical protein